MAGATVSRFAENPIVEPADVKPSRDDFEVICAFNAGAVRLADGQILVLLRVAERPQVDPGWAVAPVTKFDCGKGHTEVLRVRTDDPAYRPVDSRWFEYAGQRYLTTISHLRAARSRDGVNFEIDPTPTISPARPYEEFGCEDPRITKLDNQYWITYTAVTRNGISTALASTEDFRSFDRQGVIFAPENRDVTIFPQKVRGRYVCHHRPMPKNLGEASIWMAWSNDLIHWGGHSFVMRGRADGWDCGRVGGGTVPIRTEQGWLAIYHGADRNNRYCLGAILLDLEDPGRILARSVAPLMSPETDYETRGFYSQVVFSNGAVTDGDDIIVYYGAADRCLAGARVSLANILEQLKPL
jgi:predicted GH43/DUF377 family glycosyl hydrolase